MHNITEALEVSLTQEESKIIYHLTISNLIKFNHYNVYNVHPIRT